MIGGLGERGGVGPDVPALPPDTLGASIREERLRRDLSQRELAKLAGVSQATVSKVEKDAPGSGAMARQVAEVLGVPVGQLARRPVLMHCPDHDCPTNLPFAIGLRVLVLPRFLEGQAEAAARCSMCGEFLVWSCSTCNRLVAVDSVVCACGEPRIALPQRRQWDTDWAEFERARRESIMNWPGGLSSAQSTVNGHETVIGSEPMALETSGEDRGEDAPTVFIAHATEFLDKALRVKAVAEEHGINAIVARTGSQAGNHLPHALEESIRSCDELWVVASPDISNSKWVRMEVGVADFAKMKILPILVRCTSDSLPASLSRVDAIDLDDLSSYCADLMRAWERPRG